MGTLDTFLLCNKTFSCGRAYLVHEAGCLSPVVRNIDCMIVELLLGQIPRLLVSQVRCVVTIRLGIASDVSSEDGPFRESHYVCLFSVYYGCCTTSIWPTRSLHPVISSF